MAAKRKPAIQARQGHPEGIIDDIILPLAGKAIKVIRGAKNVRYNKVIDKLEKKKPTSPRLEKAYKKQDKIARSYERGDFDLGNARQAAYERTADKQLLKSELKAYKGKSKAEDRAVKKYNVASAKARAVREGMWDLADSPRKAAQAERLRMKKAAQKQKKAKNK